MFPVLSHSFPVPPMSALRLAVALLASSAGFAADPPPKLTDAPKPPAGFPSFKIQEIDAKLKIGYAVIAVDIDGDGKRDIVVVDQHQVVWYQNPTWQKRVILDGKTKPDNVCIAAVDIDGDGKPELILGAGWKPFDTTNPGTLQWLKRGKTLDDEWTMHAIPCDEPTVHRVQVYDAFGDGKPAVVLVPLMGKGATKEKNWQDGRPVRVMAYRIPAKNPEKAESWKAEVLNEDLRVVHNFAGEGRHENKNPPRMYFASYDGLHRLTIHKDKRTLEKVGDGDQANPKGSRGASEVAVGLSEAFQFSQDQVSVATRHDAFAATVEPWHGNKVVVYQSDDAATPWKRTVLDEQLRWGHAVRTARFGIGDTHREIAKERAVGSQIDSIVVGVRDNPTKDDRFAEKRGVRLYGFDPKAKTWARYILDDGGVAVEDLIVAHLNDDTEPDIVAVGRATGNVRIYWNQGK